MLTTSPEPATKSAFRCPLRYEGDTAVLTADTGDEVRLYRRRLEQIERLFPASSNRLYVWPNGKYPQVKIQTCSPDGDENSVGLASIIVALGMIEDAERNGKPFPRPGWTAEIDPEARLDFRDERLAPHYKPAPNTCLLDNIAERLKLTAEGIDPDSEFCRRRRDRRIQARTARKAERFKGRGKRGASEGRDND